MVVILAAATGVIARTAAVGSGGAAMEQLMKEGVVGAVFDYAMGEIADFPPLADLAESTRHFPHFRPFA